MKLPVVSSDATSVRVKYMGELQTIPIAATRFEDSEPPDAAPSEIPPIVPTKPAAAPSATPGTQLQVSLQRGYHSRMQGGDISMRELQLLLSSHCSEGVDLSGAGTKIYNGVTYLMDLNKLPPISVSVQRSLKSTGGCTRFSEKLHVLRGL